MRAHIIFLTAYKRKNTKAASLLVQNCVNSWDE